MAATLIEVALTGGITAAMIAWVMAMISLWGQPPRPRRPDPVPDLAPEPDLTVLHYCQGCGHRHRHMWMGWTPEGTYRCLVCCETKGDLSCPYPMNATTR